MTQTSTMGRGRGTNEDQQLLEGRRRRRMPLQREVEVPAFFHSDDGKVSTPRFDASSWFEDASDAQLRALADIGWKGVREPFAALIRHRFEDPDVEMLLDYCSKIGRRLHGEINSEAARSWIAANRPALYATL